MRVLHLTHTDPRTDNRILKEIESLSSNKSYSITCIGLDFDEGSSKSKIEINARFLIVKLVFKLPKFFPRPIRHLLLFLELNIRFFIKSIRFNPDVIHCHDTMVLPIGTIIKILTNSKLIYDAHELESNKNGQTFFLSKATLFIEKCCWPMITHLISVSDSILVWYNENLGVKEQTLILNSPSIINYKINSSKYFHKLYGIADDTLIFVYLGILGDGRGIKNIIDAFHNYRLKSHVVFIGYGPLYETIAKVSAQTNNIHIHPPVPHEEVVSLVKNANYGLCLIENISLSDFYCLPNKLFEYTFAGLPILASDFPDIKGLVQKYQLGRICDGSSNSIATEVKEIENSPDLKITADLSELSWQSQAKKLLDLYNNL